MPLAVLVVTPHDAGGNAVNVGHGFDPPAPSPRRLELRAEIRQKHGCNDKKNVTGSIGAPCCTPLEYSWYAVRCFPRIHLRERERTHHNKVSRRSAWPEQMRASAPSWPPPRAQPLTVSNVFEQSVGTSRFSVSCSALCNEPHFLNPPGTVISKLPHLAVELP